MIKYLLLVITFVVVFTGGFGVGRYYEKSLAERRAAPDMACRNIRDACRQAGFRPGGHAEKKGLMMDCLQPILRGEVVASVSISPKDLSLCQAQRGKAPTNEMDALIDSAPSIAK